MEIAQVRPLRLHWDRGLVVWLAVLVFTILCLLVRDLLPWTSAYPAQWVPPVANAIVMIESPTFSRQTRSGTDGKYALTDVPTPVPTQ